MTMTDKKLPDNLHRDTLAVRAAVDKSQFGENSEAMYLTSGSRRWRGRRPVLARRAACRR